MSCKIAGPHLSSIIGTLQVARHQHLDRFHRHSSGTIGIFRASQALFLRHQHSSGIVGIIRHWKYSPLIRCTLSEPYALSLQYTHSASIISPLLYHMHAPIHVLYITIRKLSCNLHCSWLSMQMLIRRRPIQQSLCMD